MKRTDAVGARSTLSDATFTASLMILYIVLAAVNISHHEMWRDEIHSWAVTKSSSTLVHLFENKIYEGHPSLWYLILYPITRLTDDPAYMQVVHFGLASLAALVFLLYSPFSRLHKALFVLGYFPLYEYAALSRNYAVGLLLIFLFCAVVVPAKKRLLVPSVLLFVLMQASLYGFFIAVALALYLAADAYLGDKSVVRSPAFIGCGVFLGLGVVLSVLTMTPPPDSGFAIPWNLHPNLAQIGRTATAIWRAYFPIPEIGLHFWNSNLISSSRLQLAGSLLLLPMLLLLLRSKPIVIFTYLVGASMMLAFMQAKHFGFLRHHGHLFILLIACLWLGYSRRESAGDQDTSSMFDRSWLAGRPSRTLLTTLLLAQCLASFYASGMEIAYTFSGGEAAARFIKEGRLEQTLLAGFNIFPTPAGYLNQDYYSLYARRYETYTIFDDAPGDDKFRPELIPVAQELARSAGKQVLFVLGHRIENASAYPLDLLAEFQPTIERTEEFYLYLLRQ